MYPPIVFLMDTKKATLSNKELIMSTKTKTTTENQTAAADDLTINKPQRETLTKFRIAILNRSGNVGKTTISRHLLAPRMEGFDDIIYIETNNADEETKAGKVLRGAQFEKIAHKIMQSMSSIIDVGSSNLEHTLELMRQIEGSHEDLDYILVPTTKLPKQRADTINTLHELITMGFEPERIKVVYNQVGLLENIDEDFSDLIFAMKKLGVEHNPNAVIYQNNFFPSFLDTGKSLNSLFTPSIDENKARQNDLRRMEMDQRTDEETKELRDLSKTITLQRNARSAITNLDNVFESLFTV